MVWMKGHAMNDRKKKEKKGKKKKLGLDVLHWINWDFPFKR